ncbi:hypothetical protein SSPIM334S_06211 [Streptomyces spiroverticillatus]
MKFCEKPAAMPQTPHSPVATTSTLLREWRCAAQTQRGAVKTPTILLAAVRMPRAPSEMPRDCLISGNRLLTRLASVLSTSMVPPSRVSWR